MTPQLRNLLILLGAIAVVLILIILFFSGNSRFRRFISIFLEDKGSSTPSGGDVYDRRQRRADLDDQSEQRRVSSSEPFVEMATLIQKSDDRMRVIESTGQTRLVDEYYELLFITRKGKKIRIECSREAYDKIPFNQQGSLTYRRNRLVKFKYYEDIVYDS